MTTIKSFPKIDIVDEEWAIPFEAGNNDQNVTHESLCLEAFIHCMMIRNSDKCVFNGFINNIANSEKQVLATKSVKNLIQRRNQ